MTDEKWKYNNIDIIHRYDFGALLTCTCTCSNILGPVATI